MKKERYIQKVVPFTWLNVLERLHAETSKGHTVITLEDVVDICNECGMVTAADDETLHVMLKLFNDLGQLMHHSEETLRHWIIIDPANFLVTPASRIICQHDLHRDLNRFIKDAKTREPERYERLLEGILDPELLKYFWSDRLEHLEILTSLLVKFGFFVPILQTDNYLVPIMLPQLNWISQHDADEPKLFGHVIFAHQEKMQRWRKQGYLAVNKAKDDGFLPKGLFPAIVGEMVAECQYVHDMSLGDMELGLNVISTIFGRHKFTLRVNEELSALELLIKVDSSLLIQERILELIGKAVAKLIPGLQYALAIDKEGGVCENGQVPKPEGHLVIIDGEGGVQQKLDKEKREIAVAPRERLSALQALKRFEKWLHPKGLRREYDIFISYRWTTNRCGGMDTELVDAIFRKCCYELVGESDQRQVQVFLDRQRLEAGRNFKIDFCEAVIHSTGIVLIVSKSALQNMLTLKQDSPADNLLIEWTLASELQDARILEFCLPVMIGDVSEDTASITNLFADGILDQLPEIACASVTTQVEMLLRKNGHVPSLALHTRTVRGTVKRLLENLGVLTWDIPSIDAGSFTPGLTWTEVGLEKPKMGTEIKNKLLARALQQKILFTEKELETFKLVSLSRDSYIKVKYDFGEKYFKPAGISQHSLAQWKRKIYSHIVKEVMKCVHKAESEKKSKVGQPAPLVEVRNNSLNAKLRDLLSKHRLEDICEKVCD